jgi:tRNA-2-methylthio-N6-dimethylallyladenosine synthase
MPDMSQTFFITTFGCQQNIADSERISSYYVARGYTKAKTLKSASVAILNTCMIRQQAEDKVTGLVKNIAKSRKVKPKIVITGCMVGMATRDETGKYLQALRARMPEVDEFLPLEEVGFDYPALRNDLTHAWVPISNGCNNFCTFCVVPFTRGREISRPVKDILDEIKDLAKKGCKEVTLLGQNVNSYGADLVKKDAKGFTLPSGRVVKPILVKHLNRFRIPTIFPYLLEEVCKIKGIETVKFISSNPWDFSDELINVIANNSKIDRNLHIAVQSGDDQILKRMNRWYSSKEYLKLVNKIKSKVNGVQISTDIIVGFPGETKKQFENSVALSKSAGFAYAYVSKYSARPNTAATKALKDDVPYKEKERRFVILNQLINHRGTIRSAVH